jgi:hypothetical protein
MLSSGVSETVTVYSYTINKSLKQKQGIKVGLGGQLGL